MLTEWPGLASPVWCLPPGCSRTSHCEEFLVSVPRCLVCDVHGDHHTWLPDGLSLEPIRFQTTIFQFYTTFSDFFSFFSLCASVGRLVSFQDP